MPGLYRINGFLVYFWANESGEPVHVHVSRGGRQSNPQSFGFSRTARCHSRRGRPT